MQPYQRVMQSDPNVPLLGNQQPITSGTMYSVAQMPSGVSSINSAPTASASVVPESTAMQPPITGSYSNTNNPNGYAGGHPTNVAPQSNVDPQSNQVQAPQTGLIGSENALLGGFTGAMGAMNQGTGMAANILGNVANQNYSDIKQPTLDFTASGSLGSDVTDPLNQAANNFNGYMQGGQNAAKLQADLSGANGQQAQQAAYAAYQSSPAMQYQMDQMRQATERSAAARGGLMSGNVLTALQKNASGIASQDYQNQFNNLGAVTNQGLNAAGQVAGLKSTQAGIAGNLQSAAMQANASLAGQKYNAQMGLLSQIQQQKESAMNNLANLASQHGLNVAGLYTGTGQQLSQGRTNAGNAMAQNISSTTAGIADLLNKQGIGVSDMMSQDINNISSMIHNAGLQDSVSTAQLASLLANINSGQANNVVNQNNLMGSANAAGTLGVGNALQGGLQGAYSTGLLGAK